MSDSSRKLPRRIVLLSWVSFLADISSEMIYPLMPLFIVGVLGAPVVALGYIEGVAQAIVSLMSAFSGMFTDRTGRRVAFVRWGYGLPILGKATIACAGSWYFVLFGRAVDRFGKGLRSSPRDALIADAIDADRRGEAFGYHRMFDTAGAVVGVFIAAFVLWILKGQNVESVFRIVFGIAALLALGSLIVTFLVDDGQTPSSRQTNNPATPIPTLRSSVTGLGREYWITLLILTTFAFANSSDAFILLRAADIGLSTVQVVLAYALYNLSYALLSHSAGKLSDRHGRWKVIFIGWIIYAIVYAGIAISNTFLIWGLFIGYGVYMALTDGVSKALIVDCVPAERKGTALGILYLALGFSALSSNLIAGYCWDNFGKSVPFWFGAFTAVAAVLAIVVSGRLKRPSIKTVKVSDMPCRKA